MSEVALFNIQKEIIPLLPVDNSIIIKTVLGSALNKKLLLKTFNENKVDIVFHAAAYKHVPLVQDNPLSGLMNNIYTTKVICECAKKTALKN